MSYLPVPAEKALPLTCERIQFSDCSEVSDQAMEPTRDVTDQAIADLVEQAVVGPEKAWQRQLVTALMPVWLDDDGDDDDNDGDGDGDGDDDDDDDDDDDAGLALHDGLHHLGTLVQAGEHGHFLKTRSFHWKPRQPPNVYSPAFNLVFKNILFFWMDLLCLSAYQHNWDEID